MTGDLLASDGWRVTGYELKVKEETVCIRLTACGIRTEVRTQDSHRQSGDNLSHRLKKMNGEDCARYQLIARATYLRW